MYWSAAWHGLAFPAQRLNAPQVPKPVKGYEMVKQINVTAYSPEVQAMNEQVKRYFTWRRSADTSESSTASPVQASRSEYLSNAAGTINSTVQFKKQSSQPCASNDSLHHSSK